MAARAGLGHASDIDELLQFVYHTCQGSRIPISLPYNGTRTRSLTVGDVIVVDGAAWLVARVGFDRVPALDRLAEDGDDQDDEPAVATDGGVVAKGPPVGQSLDVRTHYGHVRYAASEEAGVIWYDPRDGHERMVLDIEVVPASLDDDERRITSVDLYQKYGRCQQADPESEWAVEYNVATRGEHATSAGETVARLDHAVRTETYESRRAAQMAVADTVPAYADAEYRNAVAARVEEIDD